MPDVFSDESIKLKTHTHRHVYRYIKKEKELPVNLKPHSPPPKKNKTQLTHAQRRKITVSEIQNYFHVLLTHTYTQRQTYQISMRGKADQSKHTLGKRESNLNINPPESTENHSNWKQE